MKIIVAGYNIDSSILEEAKKHFPPEQLTPETISAAYARISRDPRPASELREAARKEVEKARKSNRQIIFGLGHSSVAEHAVFNLDFIGISRLAVEAIENFRIGSYTEKSQRYITLKGDFVIPPEIKGSPDEDLFLKTVEEQNRFYLALYEKLKPHVFTKHKDLAEDPKSKNMLEGWAKEDARYALSLATETQLGATLNARTIEAMLSKFASHPLTEIREIGKTLFEKVEQLAPSVIKYTQATDYYKNTKAEMKELVLEYDKNLEQTKKGTPLEVELIRYLPDAENIIAASLFHSFSKRPMRECLVAVSTMGTDEKKELYKKAFRYLKSYDRVLREFEYVPLLFEVTVSASCFAQLKRHRMATITSQDYNPGLGYTIPPSIKEVGMEKELLDLIEKTNDVFAKIGQHSPDAAPYILTNAHRKRVLLNLNIRELYHFSRMREDSSAQWDIRNISTRMSVLAKKAMPLATALLGGKDSFDSLYNSFFEG